jgi:hypothetical protein
MQFKFRCAIAIMLLALATAQARINVVTLPDRDSTQLTIYNSVDLTLVKETRHLTLRRGLNKLEFSWANTLIDPTSVEFRALSHPAEVEVLDVSFPPRAANTLEWRLQSEVAGDVVVEIHYFTSGISWQADYVAEAAKDESAMSLSGAVRVNNRSGEDYENAQLRLVVGTVRLVEEIARLAAQAGKAERLGRDNYAYALHDGPAKREAEVRLFAAYADFDTSKDLGATMAGRGGGVRKQVIKESLSEYFLYSVEGRDTIPNGWAKRLPSFRADLVPLTSFYKYEKEQYGERVMRFYRFTNSEPARLGREPLPDGAVKAFRHTTDDQLYAFIGRAQVKYIPINEQVDMELGHDLEVRVQPTLTNWAKLDISFGNGRNVVGWTEKHGWQIEVQNSKDIPVVVDVRRNFSGDWEMESATPYEKVDATKVKFLLPLKPREKVTIGYLLTVRHGTNVRK